MNIILFTLTFGIMGLTYKIIVNYRKLHLLFKIQFAMSIYYYSKIIIIDSVRAEIVQKLDYFFGFGL